MSPPDKTVKTENFNTVGFFALRTPLLPFDDFLSWGEGISAHTSNPESFPQALTSDRELLRSRLRQTVERPEVREALFVSSPDLVESLPVLLRDPDSERGRRVELALVRYFSRMCGRATPFGLCAGVSVGTTAKSTKLELGEKSEYRRHTRLDTNYLTSLVDLIGKDESLRRQLLLKVNDSLYAAAGRLHFAQARTVGQTRSYHLAAVDETGHLTRTLRRANSGALLDQLASALITDDPEISPRTAAQFVSKLLDNQVLVQPLGPAVTGREPIHNLISLLEGLQTDGEIIRLLKSAQSEIENIDREGVGVDPSKYICIADCLKQLPVEINLSKLFQVDLIKPSQGAQLGERQVRDIKEAVHLLHRLSSPDDDGLREFRAKFMGLYGSREVPLLEALDGETGTGHGVSKRTDDAKILGEIPVTLIATNGESKVAWTAREAAILRKLLAAHASGVLEISLTDEDLKEMEIKSAQPLPESFAVMATIAASSSEAISRGDYRIRLDHVTGPSGAIYFGRFCYADPQLQSHVERLLRAEEALHPRAIYAEIVHLPEGRLGNILIRPVLREYEIAYLGDSGAKPEKQIPLTDLMVSVVDGWRVRLRSRTLNREIIPRLTSAHYYNHPKNRSLYRFLCSLQRQGLAANVGWSWGVMSSAPFLPRVSFKRVVLSRATWNLAKKEIESLSRLRPEEEYGAVQEWRKTRKVPRFVALVESDNELPIDLDNVLSVEMFIDQIKGQSSAQLVEMFLSGPDELCVQSREGRFVSEIILPFAKTEPNWSDEPLREVQQVSLRDRRFHPGSEWLYLKLYAGYSTADQILRHAIKPAVESIIKRGLSDRWFFIRYDDPTSHLRLRFQGEPHTLEEEVWPMIQNSIAPFLEDGRIRRVQFDTYEREVERYGGLQATILAEELFCADSDAMLTIIETLTGDSGADLRWYLALKSVDLLMTDFGLDLGERRTVSKEGRRNFTAEFNLRAEHRHALGDRYRAERMKIEDILSPSFKNDRLRQCLSALGRRSQRIKRVVDHLKLLEESGELEQSVQALLLSYIHMHINRMFQSGQRAQEMTVYEFLDRYYDSRQARLRGARPVKTVDR